MPKSTLISCVKNANNHPKSNSIISGLLSPNLITWLPTNSNYVRNCRLYQFYLPPISTTISTYRNAISYLLNKSFTYYPHHLLLELLKEIKER